MGKQSKSQSLMRGAYSLKQGPATFSSCGLEQSSSSSIWAAWLGWYITSSQGPDQWVLHLHCCCFSPVPCSLAAAHVQLPACTATFLPTLSLASCSACAAGSCGYSCQVPSLNTAPLQRQGLLAPQARFNGSTGHMLLAPGFKICYV